MPASVFAKEFGNPVPDSGRSVPIPRLSEPETVIGPDHSSLPYRVTVTWCVPGGTINSCVVVELIHVAYDDRGRMARDVVMTVA